MATVLDLINDALQELGVYGAGETVSADDASVCLNALNNLIDGWNIEGLYLYAQQDVSATLPANTDSLTIGPSQDFNTVRPIRIERGSFVRVGNLDYPLDAVLQDKYNEVTMKSLTGPWPRYCVYDETFPTGTVYFWPLGACEVHLNLTIQLSSFAATDTSFSMPPGYRRALSLTLAEEVATKFERQVSAMTTRKAYNARRVLKRANEKVPQLRIGCEDSLPGRYAILGG